MEDHLSGAAHTARWAAKTLFNAATYTVLATAVRSETANPFPDPKRQARSIEDAMKWATAAMGVMTTTTC